MPRSTPGAKATRDSKPSSFVGRTRKRMRCDQKPLKMGNAITKSACEEESSSQNKAQSQILSHFSDDILSRILFSGYLDTSPRDLSNRMRVCKRFQSVAKHSVTVIDAHRGDRFNEPTSQMFFNIIGQFPHLQEVDFSFCRNFNDAHLDCLSSLRAQLRVLRLKGTSVTDDGVMSFFEYDKRTKSYKNQTEALSDDSIQKCTSGREFVLGTPLEVLDLSNTCRDYNSKITDRSLLAISYACPNLRVLQLSWRKGITDTFLDSVPLFLRKLQALDLSMCCITSRGCCTLSRSPSLREVNISACTGTNGEAIQALITGKLVHTDIDEFDCNQNGMEKEIQLGLVKERNSKSQLTSITACFASEVDANLFETMTTHAPHLKRLDLRKYHGNDLMKNLNSNAKSHLRQLKSNGVGIAFSTVYTSNEY